MPTHMHLMTTDDSDVVDRWHPHHTPCHLYFHPFHLNTSQTFPKTINTLFGTDLSAPKQHISSPVLNLSLSVLTFHLVFRGSQLLTGNDISGLVYIFIIKGQGNIQARTQNIGFGGGRGAGGGLLGL